MYQLNLHFFYIFVNMFSQSIQWFSEEVVKIIKYWTLMKNCGSQDISSWYSSKNSAKVTLKINTSSIFKVFIVYSTKSWRSAFKSHFCWLKMIRAPPVTTNILNFSYLVVLSWYLWCFRVFNSCFYVRYFNSFNLCSILSLSLNFHTSIVHINYLHYFEFK